MTKPLLLAGLALIFASSNWAIFSREQLKASGTVVYLELAPVDPRSLMQGDYMALRYKLDITTPATGPGTGTDTAGFLIVRLDERRVATAIGWNTEPAASELRLKYRTLHGRTTIGSDAFFFEEGSAGVYQRARFGEFRVDSQGNALLTGLRDANLQRLGPH